MTTDLAPATAAPAGDDLPAPRPRVDAGWLLVAGLVAGAVYAVVATGVLTAVPTLALAAALVVAVPTHSSLTRRLALNLAVLVGWAPLTWWVRWPVPVNHAAVLMAVAAAGLVVCARRHPAGPAGLRPALVRADLLLLPALALPVAAMRPWYAASGPRAALEALLPGADNWAHFAMFVNLRVRGATSDALGAAPDGSGWGFGNYPKGFHALAATLSEVTHPHLAAGTATPGAYLTSLCLVVLVGVVLVTAAVASLPPLAARPLVALPGLALTWTALLWEPGQKIFADGFTGFWLGAVAAGVAVVLGLTRGRPRLVDVVAVCGLLVCVSHCWTPLACMALPAVVLVVAPFVRDARAGDARSRVALLIVVAGAAASLKALFVLLATVPVGLIVSVDGGFTGTSPLPTFVFLVVGLYLPLAHAGLVRRRGDGPAYPERWQVRSLLLTPLVGTAALAVLLVAQVRTLGTTSYYFLKFLLGFELVLAVVVPALVCLTLAVVLPRTRRLARAVTVSVVAGLLGTQLFGFLPVGRAALFSTTSDGTAGISAPYTRAAMAEGIVSALGSVGAGSGFERDYLALGPGNAAQIFYPDAWVHAATASLSLRTFDRMGALRTTVSDADQAAPLVRSLLSDDPDLVVVTPTAFVGPLRDALDDPALAARVRTSDVPGR